MNPNKNHLEAASWLFASIGFAFCILSFFDPAFDRLNAILIPDAAPADPTSRLYALVMGAVLAGFGTTLAILARTATVEPGNVDKAILAGFSTWFFLDTGGSLLHGSWQNAVFNSVALAIFLPGLMQRLRRQ